MKKVLALFLTFALIVTMLPNYGGTPSASAAGQVFIFPNEEYVNPINARTVSTQTIQLQGTINGVVGNSISYKVEQVTQYDTENALNKTEDITTGILTTNDNKITVSGLTLFPGLNKITFKGVAGASETKEHIFIEYRNSPMLYDLKVNFENKEFDMPETEPVMLYSTAPAILDKGQIVITGKAPNAQKVTIVINGRSYDFNVSSATAESRFSTSQLTVDKGINIITFKVYNGGQVVETTRELAFYNGEVTYYNLKMKDKHTTNPQTVNFEQNLNFLTNSNAAGYIGVEGTAIIPLPLRDLNNADPAKRKDVLPVNKANLAALLSMELELGTSTTTPTISTQHPKEADIAFSPSTILESTKFITVNFAYALPEVVFDKSNRLRFKAPNNSDFSYSGWNYFTVRNSDIAYIQDINYLSGYDKSMNDSRLLGLQGTDIPSDGVNVYSMPMAVEILVGNYTGVGDLKKLFKVNGLTETDAGDFKQLALTEVVYQTINNQRVPFMRMFIEINKLPKSGTNSIKFQIDRVATAASQEEKTIIAKLLYGPFVKLDSVVDGMGIKFDAVRESDVSLLTKLGSLNGQLFNVVNDADIVFTKESLDITINPKKKQTVFLYVNNVEIPLEMNGSRTKFKPQDLDLSASTNATRSKIFNVLNKAGENTIKFVYYTDKNLYENVMKFNIVPENLPIIPAPNTDGVYPYSESSQTPIPNDPAFAKQGTVFTTKDAFYNVYGTFDFVDLGIGNQFTSGHASLAGKENYKVTISSPNWKGQVDWDLSKEFWPTKNGEPVDGYRDNPFNVNPNDAKLSNPSTQDAAIKFYYDVDKQHFYFKIDKQMMPIDGSSQVYVITVYNSGPTGPRATYRLEINSVSIPYSIKSPLKEEMVTNQNFVEVIITSPGADSMTIGKEAAEKVTYIDYVQGLEAPVDAFRAVVKNLGANKDTKIPFTITRGKDTIKQELKVKYVPVNIPGAQMMQSMTSSHKVFNNALTLTFAGNTQLIRPSNYKIDNDKFSGQVYRGNDILFAIANPDNGIVNLHEFSNQPPNYSAENRAEGNLYIGYRFQDQARQFIKASPLFWIDAGYADNPNTDKVFDPITTGSDPFPFPNIAGKKKDSFAKRYGQNGLELVPSAPGKLTLAYDSSVAQVAGTTITVFRFDPYSSTWENIGGVVDEKKHTITASFTKFGYYVAVKLTRGYNDITDHPYAREAMEAIFAKGIMNAIDPIGIFGGDRYVTRGEFTRMIVRALELPLSYEGANHFSYYPETITNAGNSNAIYDYRYIETAARAGIVNGTRPGFFDEDVEISRQQAATILARALNLKLETNSAKAKSALDKVYKDSGIFDFYSIPSVMAIQKKGFIQGKLIDPLDPKAGSVFEPKARLLRSDAAIIMARVMNDLKKLPKIYN